MSRKKKTQTPALVLIEGGRNKPHNLDRLNAMINNLTVEQLRNLNCFLDCLRCPLKDSCIPFRRYEQQDPNDPMEKAFATCPRRSKLKD
ncbi:hypothetical protein [Agrobacterium leguminum]|uniref:hypothetical protein n=1 Tax=Agrobacterium leguminum TaxID=2792015 RepID=UPI003CE5728F